MHAARARDFAVALEAARDGMVRLDRDGRILGMNRGAEALFGYDQNETAGDSFLTLFAPAGARASRPPRWTAWRAAKPGRSRRSTPSRAPRDGREFPVRLDFGRLANAARARLFSCC